jgi:hypothetical protein
MPLGGTALVPLPSTSSLPANVTITQTLGQRVRAVCRPRRNRHDGPRHLSKRSASRSDIRSGADAVHDRREAGIASCSLSTVRLPGGWYIQGAAQGVNILTGNNLQRLRRRLGLFINTLQHPANSCNATVAARRRVMGKSTSSKPSACRRYYALHRRLGRGDHERRRPATRFPACSTAS